MKTSTRALVTLVTLILLVGILYFFSDWFSKTTGYAPNEDERIKLAQCLDEKNAVFYLTKDCANCDAQVEEFGEDAFEYISVFDCSVINGICKDIKRFPAWEINNKIFYGKKSFEDLVLLSKCNIELD